MRRATKARIIRSHNGGNAVQHTFLEVIAIHVMPGHLVDAAVDRQIIVPGRDNQIGPGDGPLLIHLVVVNQNPAGRFNHAYTFEIVHPGVSADVFSQNGRRIEQRFHAFCRVESFYQPRVVEMK